MLSPHKERMKCWVMNTTLMSLVFCTAKFQTEAPEPHLLVPLLLQLLQEQRLRLLLQVLRIPSDSQQILIYYAFYLTPGNDLFLTFFFLQCIACATLFCIVFMRYDSWKSTGKRNEAILCIYFACFHTSALFFVNATLCKFVSRNTDVTVSLTKSDSLLMLNK